MSMSVSRSGIIPTGYLFKNIKKVFKMEREYWSLLKPLLLYLNKYPIGMMPSLEVDPDLEEELEKL